MKPFKIEFNVTTKERKIIELTDEEILDMQNRKAIEDASNIIRLAEEQRKAKRQALLEKLLDAEEAKVV